MEKPESKNNYYEDRINLYEYFQVFWRWKFIIVGIVILSVIAALLISFKITPVYRVSTLISPGSIEELDEDTMKVEQVPVDSTKNFVDYINGGKFNPKLYEALNIEPFGLQFNAKQPKDAYVLHVHYETTDPALGLVIVRELLNQIENDYSWKIALDRYNFNEILNEVVFYLNKINLLETQENEVTRFIKKIDENTESIMKQRDRLLSESGGGNQAALLLYLNTIQQNIAYINTLNTTLQINREGQRVHLELLKESEIRLSGEFLVIEKLLKKPDIGQAFLDLILKYDDLLEERPSLKPFLEKIKEGKIEEDTSDTKFLVRVIQEPSVGSKPIKPRRTRMVLISIFLSLFFGIFLAIFVDFLKRNVASFKQT